MKILSGQILIVPIFLLVLSCNSHSDIDPTGTPADGSKGYTQDAVWDLRAELSARNPRDESYYLEFAMLNSGRLLVGGNAFWETHLLELDWQDGSVLHNERLTYEFHDFWKRSDGQVVMDYSGTSKVMYNEQTHTIDDVKKLPASQAQLDKLYTHMIGIEQVKGPYLMRTNMNDEVVWKTYTEEDNIDAYPPNNYYLVGDHMWFIGAQDGHIDWSDERWKLGKIRAAGELAFLKQITIKQGAPTIYKEDPAGNLFLTSLPNALWKFDSDGNQLWQTTVSDGIQGKVQTAMVATRDGGVVMATGQGTTADVTMFKYDASGKLVWKEKYYERTGMLDKLYELPNGDLLATSATGFVVKYKLNK